MKRIEKLSFRVLLHALNGIQINKQPTGTVAPFLTSDLASLHDCVFLVISGQSFITSIKRPSHSLLKEGTRDVDDKSGARLGGYSESFW